MYLSRWAALALCLALSATGAARAQEPAARPLVLDPAIRRGVLPNGLRYVVMHNPTPADGLSLRLAFEVGSLVEEEGERGAAHFIEHMAFRASRNFPEGELDPAFAPMGVAFGRDQNAFTSTQATIYRLDLPKAGPVQRATALRWLRDVAGGVVFDAAAVDRERGVVLAERGAMDEPDAEVTEAIEAFHAPGSRTLARPPIGDPEVLRAITPARLEAFYRRWYRPEHAVLIIVGDLPAPAELEAELARAFGDWRGAGPAPARPALPAPDLARGLSALAVLEPRVDGGVSICRLKGPEDSRVQDMAALRRGALRDLWMTSLQARLDRLSRGEASVLSATALVGEGAREATRTCLNATMVGNDWKPVLGALQDEARRFSSDGPSEIEVESAISAVRGVLLGDIAQAATRDSATLASDIADGELLGQPAQEPRQALRAFNQAVETITAADVASAWRADWSGAGPLIVVVGREVPGQDAILAAWRERQGAELGAYVAAKPAEWAYGRAGPVGRVTAREPFADPKFVRLRFKNGVVLNLRQTAFDKGAVELRVDFGHGREDLGERSIQEGRLASDFFLRGGLGRHPYAEIEDLAGPEPLSMELVMYHRSFTLEANSFVEHLPAQLQLIGAYLSDPGFRPDADAKIPTVVANLYSAAEASPAAAINHGLRLSLLPGGRARPPQAKMAALTARDFAALLKPVVTTAPLEVTLVGDIDEAQAVKLVAATLGALPERGRGSPAPAYGGYQHFPDPLPGPVRVTHSGPRNKAAVALAWPLFVSEPGRRREEHALELLAAVFGDALRHSVREQLGKAYAPTVEIMSAGSGDQAYLLASVETAPGDLAAVEAEIRALAARLAKGEISQQALAGAQAPLMALAEGDLSDNAWVADHLSTSSRDPAILRDLTEGPRILAGLTLADVRQAAATWLARPALLIVATPETPR